MTDSLDERARLYEERLTKARLGLDSDLKRLETVALDTVKRRPIEWLFKPLLAIGKISLISGDPGLGKSMAACGFVATLSSGGRWPDGSQAEPAHCLLMSGEDDAEDTLEPRLAAAGADARRITLLSMVSTVGYERGPVRVRRPFNLKNDLDELSDWLAKKADTRLIIIDPIASFMDGVDSHINSEVRSILTPLAEMASRHRVAILCITHQNKGASKAIYRVMGSLAFTAAARIAYSVVPDRDDDGRRLLLPVKNNIAKDSIGWAYGIREVDEQPVAMWHPEPVHMRAQEYVDDEEPRAPAKPSKRTGRPRKLEEIGEWLRQMLASGPQLVVDIEAAAQARGFGWRSVERAKEAIGAQATRRFSGAWEWVLDVQ